MATLPTNAAFLSAVQGMTVTGVTRHYDNPPYSLSTADLPAAFPLWPGTIMGEWVSSCIEMAKRRNIGVVICIEPSGQGTAPQNYATFAALMDNLEAAIAAAFTPAVVNFYEYEITTRPDYPVGDMLYWAIIATISVRSA